MKTLLITGSTGFLGRRLVPLLESKLEFKWILTTRNPAQETYARSKVDESGAYLEYVSQDHNSLEKFSIPIKLKP